MSDKNDRVRFKIPKGFAPPEGSEKDGKFDIVCTFEIEGGDLCLEKLGDFDMPDYDEKKETAEHKPDYKAEAGSMTQAMGNEAGMAPAGGGY